MKLSQQRCVPCEGGTPPMSGDEARQRLGELHGWTLKERAIEKTFTFKNFVEAMAFVNRVAAIAEQEGHHPDIAVSYRMVTLTLFTHAIGGLSLNDFIVAAKVDELEG